MIIMEIPNEFRRLFDRDWREAAIYGGRYSLKSHSVARVLLIKARQQKTRIGCFREFQSSIADSSHQLLSDLIKSYNLTDFEVTDKSIINKLTGSDFLFKGLWNNEQTIKSIEGIDIAWVEEAQTISKESLEVLTPTVRKDGSQIIYTYNRFMEDDPIHTRLVIEGRPNSLIINVNYDVAAKYGLLPKVIADEIEDDKKNRPALYRHKWLGEPSTTERKIYTDWQIIDEIPHEARLERTGLDYGYTNDPTAIVDVYYYNGGYIFDEVVFQKGLSNAQIATIIKNKERQAPVAPDSAEPKSNDELRLLGLTTLDVPKGRDSVRQGIQFVQDKRCSVTKRSSNVIKEYRNYVWLTDKDGKILNEPDHTWSHSMDAIRYAMQTLKPMESETVVAQQQMFRRNYAQRALNSTR